MDIRFGKQMSLYIIHQCQDGIVRQFRCESSLYFWGWVLRNFKILPGTWWITNTSTKTVVLTSHVKRYQIDLKKKQEKDCIQSLWDCATGPISQCGLSTALTQWQKSQDTWLNTGMLTPSFFKFWYDPSYLEIKFLSKISSTTKINQKFWKKA